MNKYLLLPVAFASLQSVASEIIKIPTETGFSGSVIAGATSLDYSSNLFKGGTTQMRFIMVFRTHQRVTL